MGKQHGFRPGRFPLTCNFVFTSFVYDAFKNHSKVDVIYIDFKKAFDSVNHKLLICVLRALGFGEPFISWFFHISVIDIL
jgi:hypothetical protein